jgi:hypothetical protein
VLVAVLLAFVAFNNTGCKGCASKIAEQAVEKAVEGATGGKVDMDAGSSVDVSGLPEILRYPGAKAKASWTMSGDEGSGTSYVFDVADPAPTVVAFYKKALEQWKSRSVMESEGTTILAYQSNDEKELATVTVGTEDNKTVLSILFVKNK